MILGGETFSAHGDLVQEFLERMDPRASSVGGSKSPLGAPVAPDPARYPNAPTDEEVQASWEETVMPMFDPTCGCGEEMCGY